LGASAGTIAGYYGRTELSRLTKIPDPIWGGLEDILALSLGLLAVQKNS
jgi:hypothetical protein